MYLSLINFLLIYISIGLSGIITLMSDNMYITLFFILLLILFITIGKYDKPEITKFIAVLIIVVLIFILQATYFHLFIVNSFFSLIITFSVGFMISNIIKDNFVIVFIRVVYIFSLISLIFYALGIVYPSAYYFFNDLNNSLNIGLQGSGELLFFTFKSPEVVLFGKYLNRNCGFLYEPGMFACILIPALAFNTIIKEKILNKVNIVIIITILTTFSTAAYLALALLIIIYLAVFKGFSFYKITISIIFLIFTIIMFTRLDFVGKKIVSQYYSTSYGPLDKRHYGRIGSALVDLEEVAQYPLIGKGRAHETRWGDNSLFWDITQRHRVNGITALMLAMGIPFFIYYIFLLYSSINNFCLEHSQSRYSWLLFILPFLIVASCQTILLRPFFISFLFISSKQSYNYSDHQ